MKGKTLFAVVMSAMILSTMASASDVLDFSAETAGEENAIVTLAEENQCEVEDFCCDNSDETRPAKFSVNFANMPETVYSMTVKVYSGDILLSTSTLNQATNTDPETRKFSCNTIYTGGRPSDSWTSVINSPWSASRCPDKVVFSVNGGAEKEFTSVKNSGVDWNKIALAADVSNEAELKAALAEGKDIVLANDVTLTPNVQGSIYSSSRICFNSNIIDLNGKTLTITSSDNSITTNATFKNGKINVATGANNNGNGIFAHYGSNRTLTFDNVELTANGLCFPYLLSDNNNSNTFVIKNSTFNVTGGSEVLFNGEMEKLVFASMGNYVVDNSTITVSNAKRGFVNGNVEIKNHSVVTINSDKDGVHLLDNNSLTVDETSTLNASANKASEKSVASVGSIYYDTLAEAFAKAKAGDTVTVLKDTEIDISTGLIKASVIDLNGKTVTINGNNIGTKFGETEIKNGNIIVKNERKASQAVFWITENNATLKFTNVKINANELKSVYLVECFAVGTKVEFNNSEITAVSTDDSANFDVLLCGNNTNTEIVINDTDITVDCEDCKILYNSDITIKGNSKIDAHLTGDAIRVENGQKLSVEDNAFINIVTAPTADETDKTRYGLYIKNGAVYSKADTATVNATVYVETAETAVTTKLAVKFVATENDRVYNIVVVPAEDGKTINRLTAAEFDFVLTTENDISYDVTAAENVNIVYGEDGHVAFNFDGKNAPDASGAEVVLGKVTFGGYGTFSFGVNADGENMVQTTTVSDNKVVTSTVIGENGNTLDVSDDLDGVEYKVPTKKLTINVDFNNAVNAQSKAYTDMKVVVTGTDYEKTFELGEIANNKVVIEISDELVENTPYTVTVSGAGYRTARYTVTMNADKTLNFWNNALTNKTEVELYKASSAKDVTFLAGDIVSDNKINLFDLNAVVSYFGTEGIDVENASEYAKYDLNRDGKINSKDVAYVLASWGK